MLGCIRTVVVLGALGMNAVATGLAVIIPLSAGIQMGQAAMIHVNDMWVIVIAAGVAFVGNGILALVLLISVLSRKPKSPAAPSAVMPSSRY